MDLASGYSDSINYGNGYTPLANNAINNNNANYAQQQAAMAAYAQAMQNNVFASGGGFGAQTDYYSGLGRDYTTATGGNIFGNQTGGGGGGATLPGGGLNPNDPGNIAEYYRIMSGGYGQPGGYTGASGGFPASTPQPAAQQGIDPFWQGVRNWTGMGQPGGSGYDPYAGLGNQGQPGVTDPFGYGSGGYQGNDIPYQNRAPVQGGTTDPFWQGIRDLAGADPKDQSRIPQSGYTPAYNAGGGLNPNDPGNIAEYYRLMGGGGGIGSDAARAPYQPAIPQQAQPDPYYWSGNFWGANDGSGIGQGAGMAPGMGGFNNPGVPTSPQQWYGNGGYNPYDPQTYGGSAMQNLGTGQPNVSTPGVFDTGTSPWAPAYLSGGGLNPNDPGNIAAYYRLMGGGGGIPIMAQGGDPQVDPLTSTLTSQRADYANRIRNDPNLSLQLASRMYSEDQNNPDTRVAIVEAMMNRLKATGQDPLNPSYYPGDQSQYNAAYNKLSGNNDLLNQVHQEMERAFGGSNLSNFATNWASGDLAKHDIQLSTPTWLSPTGEQFYRKDISNEWAGPGIADQNQRWFQSLSSPPR